MNPFEDNRTEARRELERQSGFGPNLCSTPDSLHEFIVRALVAQLERQEQELAAMKEQHSADLREIAIANFRRDTWKKQCEARDEIIDALKQELAALKSRELFPQGFPTTWLAAVERMREQHSADLREITEMAIAKCEAKYLPAIKYMYDNSGLCAEMGCGCEASQVIAPVLWADMRKELFNVEDILREFREKKAKVNHD